MKIPRRLEEKLSQDRGLHGAVLETDARFSQWVGSSKMVFFPTYTDHGLGHFEDVLSTASDIIPDVALAVLTPIDVSVVIYSVMLHDCGMHLGEDGFLTLIQHNRLVDHGEIFKDVRWPTLWEQFLEESRRFNGHMWTSIVGDDVPVRVIPDDPRDWTERHRLFIGEFVRA